MKVSPCFIMPRSLRAFSSKASRPFCKSSTWASSMLFLCSRTRSFSFCRSSSRDSCTTSDRLPSPSHSLYCKPMSKRMRMPIRIFIDSSGRNYLINYEIPIYPGKLQSLPIPILYAVIDYISQPGLIATMSRSLFARRWLPPPDRR